MRCRVIDSSYFAQGAGTFHGLSALGLRAAACSPYEPLKTGSGRGATEVDGCLSLDAKQPLIVSVGLPGKTVIEGSRCGMCGRWRVRQPGLALVVEAGYPLYSSSGGFIETFARAVVCRHRKRPTDRCTPCRFGGRPLAGLRRRMGARFAAIERVSGSHTAREVRLASEPRREIHERGHHAPCH